MLFASVSVSCLLALYLFPVIFADDEDCVVKTVEKVYQLCPEGKDALWSAGVQLHNALSCRKAFHDQNEAGMTSDSCRRLSSQLCSAWLKLLKCELKSVKEKCGSTTSIDFDRNSIKKPKFIITLTQLGQCKRLGHWMATGVDEITRK